MPIKAVVRNLPANSNPFYNTTNWLTADLVTPGSLDTVVAPGDVVVNLAYMPSASEAMNVQLIENVIEACVRCRAARLVHCSTAVVVGAAEASRVDETTRCVPMKSYEKTKMVLEQKVHSALARGLDVGILRPTAIVGPGGQNLAKLAHSLQHGSRPANYLRASLFGRRPMHLVSARNVAAALLHLALLPVRLKGNIYILSADNDPANNFQSVEVILSSALGLKPRTLPLLPVPQKLLSLVLKLLGRSETNMDRRYDATKLMGTNFQPVDSIAGAVKEFGESLRNPSITLP